MNENLVLQKIKDGNAARSLLQDANPNFERRFKRLTTGLANLLGDIHKHFPDATYYTASGGLHVLLGNSHDSEGNGQQDLIAADATTRLSIGDGDF